MEKIKNALILIGGIVCFIGVIGLLMAYNDGLLEGTVFAKIISIAFPSFLGAFGIMLVTGFWVITVFKKYAPLGIIFLGAFVLLAICIILLNKEILYAIAMVIFALVVISIIVFWVKKLFD